MIGFRLVDGLDAIGEVLDQPEAFPGAEPFQTLPWFRNFAATALAPVHSLRVVLAEDSTRGLVACLPLLASTVRHYGLRQRRVAALANFYSPLFGPAVHANSLAGEHAIANGLSAFGAELADIDRFDLHPLDTAAAFYTQAQTALGALGFRVDTYHCFGNWFVKVEGLDFDRYLAERPSRLRNTLHRAQRRLAREARGDIEIVIEPGVRLESAITEYQAVYAASWKRPEPHPAFMPGLCRMAAGHGWLRLGVLRIDGRAAAAQVWLVKDAKASIFKLAYDAAFERFSPGTILTAALMRHVLDVDRVVEIDYLMGDEPYKRDWMVERRERRGVVGFNRRTVAGCLAAVPHFVGRRLRGR